jgi:hypothetical protein
MRTTPDSAVWRCLVVGQTSTAASRCVVAPNIRGAPISDDRSRSRWEHPSRPCATNVSSSRCLEAVRVGAVVVVRCYLATAFVTLLELDYAGQMPCKSNSGDPPSALYGQAEVRSMRQCANRQKRVSKRRCRLKRVRPNTEDISGHTGTMTHRGLVLQDHPATSWYALCDGLSRTLPSGPSSDA